MLDYRLEHIFTYTGRLKSPEVIGPGPEGIRANFYVVGGSLEGPRVKAELLPVGGDWLLLRPDGVCILDVRATFQTDDGALIYTIYNGVSDLGDDGYQKFVRQELPPKIPLRIAPRYITADPKYAWLNRIQGIGIGEADMTTLTARYDVYAVR